MRAGNIEEMRMWNDVEIDEVAGNGPGAEELDLGAGGARSVYRATAGICAVPEWLTGWRSLR